jgi:hypothetical protein
VKRPGGKTSKGTSRSRQSSRAPAKLEPVLSAISAAMKQLKARWYVFGAQAVALHGAQRATQDVDVTALRRAKLIPQFEDEAFVAQTSHPRLLRAFEAELAEPGLVTRYETTRRSAT